jgi:hypothetical protein
VILEIKDGNKFVNTWGQTLEFESLTACISYLRDLPGGASGPAGPGED